MTHFALAYYLQKKLNDDFYAIIDTPNKPKTMFLNQKLVNFKKTWFFHDHIKKSIKKPDLIQMLKDKDIHDNSSYYRLKENRPDLELPELFSAFPDFTFEETYDNSPYYSKQECIENIKNIKTNTVCNDGSISSNSFTWSNLSFCR